MWQKRDEAAFLDFYMGEKQSAATKPTTSKNLLARNWSVSQLLSSESTAERADTCRRGIKAKTDEHCRIEKNKQ